MLTTYAHLIEPLSQYEIKNSHKQGFWFGFSQFTQNAAYATLFYAGSQFVYHFPNSVDGKHVFLSMFVMMFGAVSSGQASAFGPDMGKAKAAAKKIWSFID